MKPLLREARIPVAPFRTRSRFLADPGHPSHAQTGPRADAPRKARHHMKQSKSAVATPADMAILGLKTWSMWAEATTVVGLRMMALAGAWKMSPDETLRMMTEKPPAFAKAAEAAARSAARGKRPDEIAAAAMVPLTRVARSNRRRLQKAGPRLPGTI